MISFADGQIRQIGVARQDTPALAYALEGENARKSRRDRHALFTI
jgi:hypothetical protein